jgi:hypothetical protein
VGAGERRGAAWPERRHPAAGRRRGFTAGPCAVFAPARRQSHPLVRAWALVLVLQHHPHTRAPLIPHRPHLPACLSLFSLAALPLACQSPSKTLRETPHSSPEKDKERVSGHRGSHCSANDSSPNQPGAHHPAGSPKRLFSPARTHLRGSIRDAHTHTRTHAHTLNTRTRARARAHTASLIRTRHLSGMLI